MNYTMLHRIFVKEAISYEYIILSFVEITKYWVVLHEAIAYRFWKEIRMASVIGMKY